MAKSFLVIFFWMLVCVNLQAQSFEMEIGPIYGHSTDTTQKFWMLVKPNVQQEPFSEWVTQFNIDVYRYFETNTAYTVQKVEHSSLVEDYYVMVSGILNRKERLTTDRDISFLIGSCAFPYPLAFWSGKKKEIIYETMLKHDKDFMLWMGDNVYYLFGEWKSKKKMHRKNLKMRFKKHLKELLESCPQYATWDDHDFGANNGDGNYNGKYESWDIFKQYWPNPYYGLDTVPGVFCHFSQADADFFMLDSRFYASDSSMLGKAQTEWLYQKLKESKANFKFIISGTQVLPINPSGEDLGDFGTARQELLDFLKQENIKGVIFLSGDRHYGELNKMTREGTYPLYEMTSSPLTSIINPGYTKDNSLRENSTLILDLNFGKIHLFGEEDNRRCRLELFGKEGQLFWQRDIFLSELQ